MDEARQYPLLTAQKNIENMMFSYPEKQLCLLGGYFFFSESALPAVRMMLSAMPAAHGALRLTYLGTGKLGEAEETEAKVPVYERPETETPDKEKRIRSWMEKPLPDGTRLCRFAIFHFGDGSWYGCEKFHHMIMDRASVLMLIRWQRDALSQIGRAGYGQWRDKIVPDRRYLELLSKGEEKTASAEQARRWLGRYFTDTEGRWTQRSWLDHPERLSSSADKIRVGIAKDLYQKLHDFAREKHLSVESIWYMAVFAELCLRKGVSHGVAGRMTSYRRRQYCDVAGLFGRAVPIAFDRKEGELWEQCAGLDEQFLVSLRYACYALDELQRIEPEADLSFDILLSYYPGSMEIEIEEDREYCEVFCGCIDTPLRVWINDGGEHPSLEIYYQTECYGRESAKRLADRWLSLAEQICNGSRWEQLTLLSEKDREAYRLVNSSAPVKPDVPPAQRLIRRCLDGIRSGRDAVVFWDGGEAWKEEQVLSWFYRAVDWLQELGIGDGSIVGVCAERSVRLPLLLFAIQHVGAAFLPVAVNESAARRQKLLSGCSLAVGPKELAEIDRMPETDAVQRGEKDRERKYSRKALKKQRAYLMYTSGSRGLPKAVEISMYSLMCRLEWMYRQYGCGEAVLQKTPYTFDVSIWELMLAPAFGGRLFLLKQGWEKLPDRIREAILQQGITRCHFVPGMLSAFLDDWEREGCLDAEHSLKEIFVSGEALSPVLAQRVKKDLPGVRLINLYGPTECTIDVSWYECLGEESEIPIGRAVANTQLYIVAPDGQTVLPAGEEGELCVAGDLVGMGYVGKEKKEQGGYVRWREQRAYRTGDRCLLRGDGELLFCGRQDSQTKVRGMRIDTSAIECLLLQQSEIRAAYAASDGRRLTAWYEADAEIPGLSARLEDQLPSYHIPDVWYWLPEFPRKENGKLEIQTLMAMRRSEAPDQRKKGESPSTPAGKLLAKLVGEYLPMSSVSMDSNLLEEGLDSLTALQLVGALRDRGYNCSYGMIYQHPSIRQLERVLKRESAFCGGIDWLIRRREEHLLVCVPYGGGESEIYGALAGQLQNMPWDIAVVRPAALGGQSAREAAKALAAQIDGYPGYTLFSYCVGSALALALLEALEDQGKAVRNVYLAASLPAGYLHLGRRKVSPWDLLPDRAIAKFLKSLQPERRDVLGFDVRIPQFRADTDRFFDYMEGRQERRFDCPVTLIFGEKDVLTLGWRKRYREWRKYFCGTMRVKGMKGAGHYFLPAQPAAGRAAGSRTSSGKITGSRPGESRIASLLKKDWQTERNDFGGETDMTKHGAIKRKGIRLGGTFALCTLVAAMLLTGCGGKGKGTKDSSGTPSSAASQKDGDTEGSEWSKQSINQVIDLTGYVELGTYKGVEVQKVQPEQVSDEDVEREIHNVLQSNGVRKEKKNKTIQKGDYATVSFQGYQGKKKVFGAYCKDMTVQVGAGFLVSDLEKGLIGRSPGKKEFVVRARLPKSDPSAYAGKTLSYHVTVSDVFRMDVPELTAETAEKYFSCGTADEVKENVRAQLEEQRKQEAEDAMADAAWNQAVANATIREYPEQQLEEFRQQAEETYRQEAIEANLSLEDYMQAAYGVSEEDYQEKLTDAAKGLLASEMVYQAVIKEEKLTLTDEEYQEGLNAFVDGEEYSSVEELEEKVDKTRLKQRILYRKAYRLVYENAALRP